MLYVTEEIVEKVPFPDCISGRAFEHEYKYPTINVQEYDEKIRKKCEYVKSIKYKYISEGSTKWLQEK